MRSGVVCAFLLICKLQQCLCQPSHPLRAPPSSVAVNTENGEVFIAAGSQLLRLNNSLHLLENVTVSGGGQLLVIALSPDGSRLVGCLGGDSRKCLVYDSQNLTSGETATVSNAHYNPQNGLAIITTNESFYLGSEGAIQGQETANHNIFLAEYNYTSATVRTTGDMRFRVSTGTNFIRHFYGGVNRNGYVYYFVADEHPTAVRVLRVCDCARETCSSDDEFDALYEMTVVCRGTSDTTRVCGVDLLESFADRNGPLVVMTQCDDGAVSNQRRNRACVFLLSDIDNNMDTFYTDCIDSNPTGSVLPWDASRSCSMFNPTSPCNFGVTPAISDGEVLFGRYLVNPGERIITASLALNVDDVSLLYVAASEGIEVYHVSFTNNFFNPTGVRVDTINIASNGSSVKDISWEEGSDYITVTTNNEVILYPLERCSAVSTCDECTDAGPLCGWCTVENKCSRRSQCQNIFLTSADMCPTTPFQVNCSAALFSGSTCINITCEEAEGSQRIVGVEVFLNGESQGPGPLPLCIPLSSLSDGVNEVVLRLTGDEGSQSSVIFSLDNRPSVRFAPNCTLVFTERRDGIVITCTTPEDSQTIAALEYTINGVDKGAASLPLFVPISDLMSGENVIELQLTGNRGSTVTSRLRVILDVATRPPQFKVDCSVAFYNATTILVNCTPSEDSQDISEVKSFMIGGVEQGPSSLPLFISLSSLAPGGDDVDLQLISDGGLELTLQLRLVRFLESRDRACLVNVVRNTERSIAQLIIYCWGYVSYNYTYNDDPFLYGTEFPVVISGDSLIDGRNTFLFQATGNDGVLRELMGAFDNMRIDLNVTCNRTAEPGREIINCMFTNPLESVMCVYDGGMPETCSFPLILDVERFGTDNHTLLITAVDGFGQTKVLEFVFQLSSRVNVNDSIIADPQFTVALPGSSGHSLCYEIHGDVDKHFNLISDTCLSVNAFFTARNSIRNRLSTIGIRAVHDSSLNGCVDIQINSTCNAKVGETELDDSAIVGGIHVTMYGNKWRVSVPNCDLPSTLMWVTCMEERLLFHVTRGSNLTPTSHGLLGQFWNIPITITEINGKSFVEVYTSSHEKYRRFPAEFNDLVWDRSDDGCYYAGDSQGGPENSRDLKESVIEGHYTQYVTDGLFDTHFQYKQFDDNLCKI